MREVTSIPAEWLRVVPIEERARFIHTDILDIGPETTNGEYVVEYDEFDDSMMLEDK